MNDLDSALFYKSVQDSFTENGWTVDSRHQTYPKAITKDGYEVYFPEASFFELTIMPEDSNTRERVFAYENNSPISPKYIAVLECISDNVEEVAHGQDN